MQFFSKKISQVYLVLFVGAFLTLTGNFTFFEKTMQIYPFAENWLFVISLSLFLFSFLSSILLRPVKLIYRIISRNELVGYTEPYAKIFDGNLVGGEIFLIVINCFSVARVKSVPSVAVSHSISAFFW